MHKDCSPRPEAMISSMRAFGYDLSMAIADLIDNSIFAQSQKITINYDWNSGSPWFRILDDGTGMTESRLHEAMRLGSQSPLETRHEADLGRFGLGLKTASFSQCKLLTVCTKTDPEHVSIRCWDLDHVCESGKWEIGTEATVDSLPLLSVLDSQNHGTAVLCQKLDRLTGDPENHDQKVQDMFLGTFENVIRYLEMVFHRYLAGRNCITITVGKHVCRPWDPFMTSNEFTQHLSTEYLDNHKIEVKPFILPHISKRSAEETEKGAGINGWNAQQGFYIYRNKRMIIPGGYLDLRFMAEEHFKLCRIKVDLPNYLDHEWNIDVRKASASPPSNVRGDLTRIARATRSQAGEVYRARAGVVRKTTGKASKQDVWLKKQRGEKILYQINRENVAIERILAELNPKESWVKKLFHLIEMTVPHRLIIIDNAEHEDSQVDLPPDFKPPPKELIDMCCQIFLERYKPGNNPHEVADYVCSFFDEHPAYRAALDKLIMELG